MNNLSKKLTDMLTPFLAVIAYKSSYTNEFYLEERKIDSKGKMGAGVPMKEKTIGNIMGALAVDSVGFESGIKGRIPPNLLYCDTTPGNTNLVWYCPPQERHLSFSSTLGIENGLMQVPGLLYVVKDNRFAVYAFKGQKPKSKLYRAPFMNVDETHVCLGNATINKPEVKTFSNVMEYWENLFWKSEFSHILGENPVKGKLATITKECIATGKPFPVEVLIPISQTLNDFMK